VILRLRDSELDLGWPVLMAIVNATPDSFSDRQGRKTVDELTERALRLVADGAAIVDVGGESGRTDTEPVPAELEAERVVPLVQELAGRGVLVSVDTWRAGVARAALDAGAVMINDVSALSDPELAAACADARAGLVVTHTRIPPKTKGFPEYEDVLADVAGLLRERADAAVRAGVGEDSIVLDPGIDLAKTPAESIRLLAQLDALTALGHPLLLAVSRKDFIGAVTGRPPAGREAGTLAALGAGVRRGARILRVHDVAAARDYLSVHAAIEHGDGVDPGLRLDAGFMRERA